MSKTALLVHGGFNGGWVWKHDGGGFPTLYEEVIEQAVSEFYAYEDEFRRGEVNPPAALQVQTTDGGRALLPKKQVDQSATLKNLAAAQKSRPLHPSQLYTTVTAFLLAAMLVAYYSTPHVPGMVFAMMLTLEGIARFVLEMLRVEPPVTFVHGTGDRFIHPRDAALLHDAANDPRRLVIVEAMGHAFGPGAVDPTREAVAWSLQASAAVRAT